MIKNNRVPVSKQIEDTIRYLGLELEEEEEE